MSRKLMMVLVSCLVCAVGTVRAEPTNHVALADHYDQEARAAAAKAKEHREKAEECRRMGGVQVSKWHMDEHHAVLARHYEEAMRRNQELAKSHHDMTRKLARY